MVEGDFWTLFVVASLELQEESASSKMVEEKGNVLIIHTGCNLC